MRKVMVKNQEESIDLFDRSPPGAVSVTHTQDQTFNAQDVSIDLKIGFGDKKNVVRLRVISHHHSRKHKALSEELFCRAITGSEWLYFGTDVSTVTRSSEKKVRSYLMERYNLDIDWDGQLPWLKD